jgi:putative aldouronate transport system permease protein
MIRQTWGDRVFQAINSGFLALLAMLVLYPLIYIVSASISDPSYVNTGQMWLWPKGLTFEGYERVFQNPDIWQGYLNSAFYTVAGVLINLAVTLPCAYALARKDLPGRTPVTLIIIFTMFFSGGLIPNYLLVKELGMVNTYWALLLPAAASAINIIVSRTFFQSNISREMEEAAAMDGCSDFRMFFVIVLPLSKAIIAVMALFYGVGHWNQYFGALIYLSDRDMFPLQLFLIDDGGADPDIGADQIRGYDRCRSAAYYCISVCSASFCAGRYDRIHKRIKNREVFYDENKNSAQRSCSGGIMFGHIAGLRVE